MKPQTETPRKYCLLALASSNATSKRWCRTHGAERSDRGTLWPMKRHSSRTARIVYVSVPTSSWGIACRSLVRRTGQFVLVSDVAGSAWHGMAWQGTGSVRS